MKKFYKKLIFLSSFIVLAIKASDSDVENGLVRTRRGIHVSPLSRTNSAGSSFSSSVSSEGGQVVNDQEFDGIPQVLEMEIPTDSNASPVPDHLSFNTGGMSRESTLTLSRRPSSMMSRHYGSGCWVIVFEESEKNEERSHLVKKFIESLLQDYMTH